MIKTSLGRGDLRSHLTALRHVVHRYRNDWIVNIAVLVICTVGLNIEVLNVRSGHDSLWPWPNSEIVLVLGLSAITLLYGIYMTFRQRTFWKIHDNLERERHEAIASVQRHCNRLVAIGSASQVLSSKSTPQDAFDGLTQICAETFPCDQVSLMMLRKESNELEVCSAIGHTNTQAVKGSRQKLGVGVAGWVAEHRKPIVLGPGGNMDVFKGTPTRQSQAHSAMIVPILVRDELVGVLCVSSRSDANVYTEEDVQALLVFSWNAAVSIRHAEQAEWMQQTIVDLQGALDDRASSRQVAA